MNCRTCDSTMALLAMEHTDGRVLHYLCSYCGTVAADEGVNGVLWQVPQVIRTFFECAWKHSKNDNCNFPERIHMTNLVDERLRSGAVTVPIPRSYRA